MTSFTYNRDIPNPPNSPSVDVPNMQVNNNSIDDLLKVDHVSFNTPNGGYHAVIHQSLQVSDPAAIATVNQIYAKVPTIPSNGDTQLFTRTGSGGISQLTGNVAADTGYTWCAGILIQWGKVTGITNGTVSFSPNFPTACYNVNTTPFWVGGSAPNGAAGISVKSLAKTGFTWVFNTNSGAYTGGGFYWVAIGN